MPATELRAALDRLELRAVAAHVPLEELEAREPEALDELVALGCSYVVVPALPRALRDPQRAAGVLNGVAARCADRGLRFAYHNHDFELSIRSAEGETLLERLMQATDPELVAFELDVFWAQVGGADPVDLLERRGGRIQLLHVKDILESGEDAPVGEGLLPWPELLEAARVAPVTWYVVEQDEPRDPLADAATSLRNALAMTA